MTDKPEGKSVYIKEGYQPAAQIEKGYQPSGTAQNGYKPATSENTSGSSGGPPAGGSGEVKD